MAVVRPMFRADWNAALFVHFSLEPDALAAHVPFDLDTRGGKAFVSAVAFTQSALRPSRGGRLAKFLSQPLARHEFLNLRAYVRVNDRPAIYFISEWIPNRLAVLIGPQLYGLPYRLGRLNYQCDIDRGRMICQVNAGGNSFACEAYSETSFAPATPESLDEFFLERYVAYTQHNGVKRRFEIDHSPWPQAPARVALQDMTLLSGTAPWMTGATYFGAHFSPGVKNVLIGPPTRDTDRKLVNSSE